jgi:hypothetical protein
VVANLLGVVAVLPSVHKKQSSQLQQFPVLEVLQFIFTTPAFKAKFAPIVAGWLDCFSATQIAELTQVLLSFMEQEAARAGQQGEEELEVLAGCCQCLNKVTVHRPEALDLQQVVARVVPVSLQVLGRVDDPEVLWPVVTLISTVISRAELKGDVLVRSIEGGNLSLLVQNDSDVLVEALCEMLRGFLCVIPR